MTWDQIMIVVFSGLGIFLLSQGEMLWGNLMALAAEPAYLWTTAEHEQWGMFLLTLWFTGCFMVGAMRAWRFR